MTQSMESKGTVTQDASSQAPTLAAVTGCCGPAEQASCCEPAAKAACCGDAAGPECGCH